MDRALSLSVDNVTIRGKGIDKTILSFKNQKTGPAGLQVTSNGFTIEDLAILPEGRLDMDRALSLSVDNVTIRGKGIDKTILSFKNQKTGPAGLLVLKGEDGLVN